jgi:tetratricopeptide (TPR) repeat protein
VLGEAWEQALVYLRDAGRQAAQQFAEVEAIACFERALLVVKRLPPEKRLQAVAIDLLLDMRNALVPLGRHRRQVEVLRSAQELAETLGDEHRLARVASFMSNYYGNVGRSHLALESAKRALALAEKLNDPEILVMGALSAGEIHRTLGNYDHALDFLTRVIRMIEPSNAQRGHGQVGLPSVRARSHLAWTLAELGDFERARNVAEEGIRIADASGHTYSVCHACLGLGGTRIRQGEFEAAVPILGRGLALTDRVPLLRPPIAADLGLAHARCGNLVDGLRHVRDAVESATTMGRLSRLPLLLVKCAEAHLLAGDTAEASQLSDEALRLASEQQERGNIVYALHMQGEVAARAGDAAGETARDHFEQALQLANELGMASLGARCTLGMGMLHARLGENDVSDGYIATARAMFRTMGMRFWLAQLDADTAGAALAAEIR